MPRGSLPRSLEPSREAARFGCQLVPDSVTIPRAGIWIRESTELYFLSGSVTGILAEDRSQFLRSTREYRRLALGGHPTGRQEWIVAAAAGFLANSIPIVHLWRARRLTTRLLETMHTLCWEVGFENGCEVQEPRDFERALRRWTGTSHDDGPRSENSAVTGEVVARVSAELRAAHLREITFGFFPVVGPVAGFLIEGSLVARFYRCADSLYKTLALTGERRLPKDFVIARRPEPGTEDERRFSNCNRGWVESFWASHLSEENMRCTRAAAPIFRSLRLARIFTGTSGIMGNCFPGVHIVRYRSIETGMFLDALQAICWRAGVDGANEAEHGRDFQRVLLRWAGSGMADSDPATSSAGEECGGEQVIAAVSAKLRTAYLWKLAFGFLPLIGPIAGFMINGSMGAHFYRVAREFYRSSR